MFNNQYLENQLWEYLIQAPVHNQRGVDCFSPVAISILLLITVCYLQYVLYVGIHIDVSVNV